MIQLLSFLFLLSSMLSACRSLDYNDALACTKNGTKVALFLGANWCPHCRREKPLYETACDKYKAAHANSDILVATVECAGSGCPGFGVSGVPDIRYYSAPTVYASYPGGAYDLWFDGLK